MLWNVRSLSNNLKLNFVQQTLEDNDIDIACITETWLSPDYGQNYTVSELQSFGFKISLTSRKNRTGGGVGILVKKSIKFSSLKYTEQYSSFEWNGMVLLLLIASYAFTESKKYLC